MKNLSSIQKLTSDALKLIENALSSQLQGTCKRKNVALLQAAHATLQELRDALTDTSAN